MQWELAVDPHDATFPEALAFFIDHNKSVAPVVATG